MGKIWVLVFVIFLILIFGFVSAESPWPMFQHDPQHTGRSPFIGPGISESPVVEILIEGEGENDYFGTPVIGSDGALYLRAKITEAGQTRHGLYALASNGNQKWFYEISSLSGMPALFESTNTLYILSHEGILAIDTENGSLKWRKGFNVLYGSQNPIVGANGTLYFVAGCTLPDEDNSQDACLIAIDQSGRELWVYGIGKYETYFYPDFQLPDQGPTAFAGSGPVSNPAIDKEGTIYFGYGDTLFAINPDGTKKWQKSFPAILANGSSAFGRTTVGTPSIADDGTIYVIVWGEKYSPKSGWWYPCFHAVDSNNPEEEKWEVCGAFFKGISVIASSGNVYILRTYASWDVWKSQICGFDSQGNGWCSEGYYKYGAISPLLVDKTEILYVFFNNIVRAFNEQLKLKWSISLGDRGGPLSLSDDGTLYIGGEKKLYVISLPSPVTCYDDIKNGDETDIDCGGSCPACEDGKSCLVDSNCLSSYCNSDKICSIPNCSDSWKNGDETDIDCGGSVCNKCEDKKSCLHKADCLSNYCDPNKICSISSCNDGWKNGDETGIDCGGYCDPCGPPPPSCSDGIQNGYEEGIDCGGICENECEYRLKLLFIPISWEGSYEDFESSANEIGNFFVSITPLKDCKQYAKIIISGNEDYGPAWSNWNCKADAGHWYTGGVIGALFGTHACAVEYWARTYEDYDYVIGLADYDVCYMLGGCSVSGLNMWKVSAVVAEAYVPPLFTLIDKTSTAHELGHKFGLKDQYCDCSNSRYPLERGLCGPHVSPNPLKIELGCDWNGICCLDEERAYRDCRWCLGNLAMNSLKRTVMSTADDADGFSIDEFNHLKSEGLECPFESASLMKMSILGSEEDIIDVVLELMIEITNNDSIMNTSIDVTSGNPFSQESVGNYSLRVLDDNNVTLYNSSFELEFIVSGIPEPLNETIIYDRIRYNTSMRKVQLYHNDSLIFQQEINFCDFDYRCEINENYYSCPNDCESWTSDEICNNDLDGVCDPDCLSCIDPDCLTGDINVDSIVNIFDLASVGLAYGSQPGDPQFNSNADLDNDGIINIFDLATVGLNYGNSC